MANADYYQKNKERIKAKAAAWAKANPEKIKTRRKEQYQKNIVKAKADALRWASENRSASNAAKRAWAQRYPERMKAAQDSWSSRNIEERKKTIRDYNQKNALHLYQKAQKWRALHPENVRAAAMRRRALVAKAGGNISAEQIKNLLEEHGYCCVYCGGPYQALDHVIPLSRGGGGGIENLRPSCQRCNSQKHAKTPQEWLLKRGAG